MRFVQLLRVKAEPRQFQGGRRRMVSAAGKSIPADKANWKQVSNAVEFQEREILMAFLEKRPTKRCAKALTNKGKACYYRRFSGFTWRMNAYLIDSFEFCRLKERREGEIDVSNLPRLAAELQDDSGSLRWALAGGADRFGHLQLTLAVSGLVHLRCQRCLTPFAFTVDSESVLILASDDANADEIDASLEDDEVDVIVGSSATDVAGLIEDEVLLAMPLSPRHNVCPDDPMLDAGKSGEKYSPFSVLNKLKQ